MHIPDRVIVRKLKEYDPYLFVTWNNQRGWFEVWREMPHGRRLITPVTASIYEEKAPKKYTQLDERILWWLYGADSWRAGGGKQFALESDKRWIEFEKKRDRSKSSMYYDLAKDIYASANAFYSTKHASKNGAPKFNNYKPESKWIRPDGVHATSSRVYSRSKRNALAYGYRR